MEQTQNRTDIVALEELAEYVRSAKNHGKKVVHCHGVFDLLHIGHIRYFERAKQLGDLLIVTVTPDRFVDKGPNRPAFNENLRAEAIASLGTVDKVSINRWPTAEDTLRLVRPDVYVKGSEYKDLEDISGKIAAEATVVEEIGAELSFTEDLTFSSTNLINRYLSNLPHELTQYLEIFRQRYSLAEVLESLNALGKTKVLVVGDTILDEYQYCTVMGKSSKDPSLALQYKSRDLFAGGVLAVANHLANFAGEVQLATILGEADSQEEFIRSHLNPAVNVHFAYQPEAPTIVKRRLVDGYSFNKIVEVYFMDDSGLPADRDKQFRSWLSKNLSEFDVVIASDFGHGAISDQTVRLLEEKAPFLAVNTQANAANTGYHTVSRYGRADYVCIAENELRLEQRTKQLDVHTMIEKVGAQLGCTKFTVTHGRKGCTVWSKKHGLVTVPAFARNVVDRVGAGDALLSVTSLAAAKDIPIEVLGFIGNVVGALAVEVLGNQKSIDKESVEKYITSLMK
ncbi:MAG: adenylyltransferase/cytidyltransferase family protein [Deltaproteobacteria bacterium]|nr:adenylyltransferase/cytidyltransferase family protein [Deltaproteobacteria bacterium]